MAPGTASDTYILRSLLPANLLAYALDPDKQAVLRLGGNGSGAIVDFEVGDDPKLMGVLWLILALILISGRELEESESQYMPSLSGPGAYTFADRVHVFPLPYFLSRLSQPPTLHL